MPSQVVVKDKKTPHYSRMAIAINEMAGMIPPDPEGMYGHTVIIKSGNVTIQNSEIDCEFNIPFDDDTEANEGEIIIYNISDKTIKGFKRKQKISVTAGYGKDTGVIFSGYISKVKTWYEDVDKVTRINAIDNNGKTERDIEKIEFAAGTKSSTILRKLVDKLGIPVAVFKTKRDHTYKDTTTVDGGLMDNIKKHAQICGVSAYICKGKVYVRPLNYGNGSQFNLSVDTGLLSVEEFEEEQTAEDYVDTIKGYDLEMLLQHRIQTGSIINLQSVNAKGTYRVREGTHEYDGENFITKVKAVDFSPTGKSNK